MGKNRGSVIAPEKFSIIIGEKIIRVDPNKPNMKFLVLMKTIKPKQKIYMKNAMILIHLETVNISPKIP